MIKIAILAIVAVIGLQVVLGDEDDYYYRSYGYGGNPGYAVPYAAQAPGFGAAAGFGVGAAAGANNGGLFGGNDLFFLSFFFLFLLLVLRNNTTSG